LVAYSQISACYFYAGNYDKYVESVERILQIEGHPEVAAAFKQAYESGGIKGTDRFDIAQHSDPSKAGYNPWDVALDYEELGDQNNAFLWLEKAYQQHAGNLIFLKVVPDFDTLRSDPRYADLVKRIGFPQ
jgi:hypothetical protein